uniref:Uncharacterized protein n=1 Tax=Raphanus sativus TaxID=3726 RepID=A0A650GB89_RAPSA|nr:hypothetical protein [Raphanus sativus]QGW48673.1 hypothetical protein [Raphanus sativus]
MNSSACKLPMIFFVTNHFRWLKHSIFSPSPFPPGSVGPSTSLLYYPTYRLFNSKDRFPASAKGGKVSSALFG